MKDRLVLAATVASAICTAIAVLVSVWTFYVGQRTTNTHMEVNLARELLKDFYGEKLYQELRQAIEQCGPLYSSWGGRFSNDDMNRYLGFFEDLGYYRKRGVLSADTIDHGFGSYLIEAFEHPHVQRYIKGLQSTAHQYEAFAEFARLAQDVEGRPSRIQELHRTREGCQTVKEPQKAPTPRR